MWKMDKNPEIFLILTSLHLAHFPIFGCLLNIVFPDDKLRSEDSEEKLQHLQIYTFSPSRGLASCVLGKSCFAFLYLYFDICFRRGVLFPNNANIPHFSGYLKSQLGKVRI